MLLRQPRHCHVEQLNYVSFQNDVRIAFHFKTKLYKFRSTLQCLHTQFKHPRTKMCAIQKMLLKSIDQVIELILIKQKQYDLVSFVRGYYTYMNAWTRKVGDENFCLKPENENQHDKFAVAIVLKERIVGYVPQSMSKIVHQFMKIPNCTIGCKVTGKRVNRGAGYGLEIPVQNRFIGAEKAVEWAEKNIRKVFENINKKLNKRVK